MIRSLALALALTPALAALAGCSRDQDAPPDVPDDTDADVEVCETDLTWASFAKPLFDTWCNACHGSGVPFERRGGAPEGVFLDSYAIAVEWGDRVAERTYGTLGGMPPSGPMPAADLALLEEWITCGMPGEEAPIQASCGTASPSPGPVAVGEGDTPCAEGWNAVSGDLVVTGDVDLSCVCSVSGDLEISGSTTVFDAPVLDAVGGSLVASAAGLVTLSVPALTTVTNSARIEHLPVLTTLGIDHLQATGADFVVLDTPSLVRFDLARLETVGGDLRIESAPALAEIANFIGVTAVGDDLVLADLPLLVGDLYAGFDSLLRVATVGGDVTVTGTGIRELWAFQELGAVPGSILISDNPALTLISGFHELRSVGGRIEIADNGNLVSFDQMPLVTSIGTAAAYPAGGLLLRRNPALTLVQPFPSVVVLEAFELTDCDSLVLLEGFDHETLQSLPGGLYLAGNASLQASAAFRSVIDSGDVIVDDNPALLDIALPALLRTADVHLARSGFVDLDGFSGLTELDGDLTVEANPVLTTIAALATIQSVAGDVVVRDNPALPQAEAEAIVDAIPVVTGTTSVTGNQ
ncbi:MAG: hypothetical protein H0V89_13620 [Deltaproteobacteria bacterium]|nr:hypothetical protein [Deltaproteobacteria bacterium]